MNRSSAPSPAPTLSQTCGVTTLRLVCLTTALLLVVLSAACTPGEGEAPPALLVGVAASIQPAAEEFAARFESDHGISVTLVTGASGTLAEQLRQGAPLDLIISADSRYTSALAADGLLDPTSATVLATGELVAITNLDDDADDVSSLLRNGAARQIALANPDIAPYGEAARRYLRDLGVWDEVVERIAYGENVAHALQFVASGNAEVGFVPRSLLIASDARGIRALAPLPPESNIGLQVTAGVTSGSEAADTAMRFIASMLDEQAIETWERFGYAPQLDKVGGVE